MNVDDRCKICIHYNDSRGEYDWCHMCAMETDCYKPIDTELQQQILKEFTKEFKHQVNSMLITYFQDYNVYKDTTIWWWDNKFKEEWNREYQNRLSSIKDYMENLNDYK